MSALDINTYQDVQPAQGKQPLSHYMSQAPRDFQDNAAKLQDSREERSIGGSSTHIQMPRSSSHQVRKGMNQHQTMNQADEIAHSGSQLNTISVNDKHVYGGTAHKGNFSKPVYQTQQKSGASRCNIQEPGQITLTAQQHFMTTVSGMQGHKDTNGSVGALEEDSDMMRGNNTQGMQNENMPNTDDMFVDDCFEGSKGRVDSMQRRSRGQRGGLNGSLGGTQSAIGTQNQSMHCTMQSFS